MRVVFRNKDFCSLEEIAEPELKLMNAMESAGCLKQQVFNLEVTMLCITSSASAVHLTGSLQQPFWLSQDIFALPGALCLGCCEHKIRSFLTCRGEPAFKKH